MTKFPISPIDYAAQKAGESFVIRHSGFDILSSFLILVSTFFHRPFVIPHSDFVIINNVIIISIYSRKKAENLKINPILIGLGT